MTDYTTRVFFVGLHNMRTDTQVEAKVVHVRWQIHSVEVEGEKRYVLGRRRVISKAFRMLQAAVAEAEEAKA